MPSGKVEALRGATDLNGFVAACREIVNDSPHVGYRPGALKELVPLVTSTRPMSWDWHLRDPEGPIERRRYDIVFSSALNGGYFEGDRETGQIRQWELNGSGSEALMRWIGRLRADGLLPGADTVCLPDEDCGFWTVVDRLLKDVPYPDERLTISAGWRACPTGWSTAPFSEGCASPRSSKPMLFRQ